MLNSFTGINVKNFRGFKQGSFSFADTSHKDKGLIVVYGQNGSGKTSLAHLFNVLQGLTLMAESRVELSKLFSDAKIQNLDSEGMAMDFLKSRLMTSVQNIIEDNKTIGSEGEAMELEYLFRLGGNEGVYRVVFSDTQCKEESLSFRLGYRKETVFQTDGIKLRLNEKAFPNSSVRLGLAEEHNRFFGQTSMLGILYNFVFSINEDYRKKHIHADVISILSFFASLSVSIAGEDSRRGSLVSHYGQGQLMDLQGLKVTDEYERIRPAVELGLSAFFSSLCFGLESVEYKKVMKEKNECYALYFNENHDGAIRCIPFQRLSSGTRRLVALFFALYNAFLGRTTIIDEVDNGIHDLIVANILSSSIESEMGQLIITTHNTLLMKKLPKGCIYFLNEDVDRGVSFYSLDDFGRKVQEKTDVVGRYLNGLYGGTPFPNVPSMGIIKAMMDEKMRELETKMNGVKTDE